MAPAWQDVLLAGTTVVFFLSLLPSVLDPGTQISRKTSVPTATAVWVQALAFGALGLYATMVGSILIAAAWTHLAWFRPRRQDDAARPAAQPQNP